MELTKSQNSPSVQVALWSSTSSGLRLGFLWHCPIPDPIWAGARQRQWGGVRLLLLTWQGPRVGGLICKQDRGFLETCLSPEDRAESWRDSVPWGPSPVPRSFPPSGGQRETQGWGILPPRETRVGVQEKHNQYHWICPKMINIFIVLATEPGDVLVPWEGTTRGPASNKKGRIWHWQGVRGI